MAPMVKNLPTVQETWIRSLSQEDSLEKEVATHSSILAWKIPWTEEPGGLQSMRLEKSRTQVSDGAHRSTHCIYLPVLYSRTLLFIHSMFKFTSANPKLPILLSLTDMLNV